MNGQNNEIEVIYDNYQGQLTPDGCVRLPNPNLKELEFDTLYHLALDTKNFDLEAMFGDVKFVCMGGTEKRMEEFANLCAAEFGVATPLTNITKASQRYAMFKVGPVLSVSHGMGVPSLSILLHEVIKLVYYAKCKNVNFFRIGTSGGLGVEPGTVCISSSAVDELLRPLYELHINGKIVFRPATLDPALTAELQAFAEQEKVPYPVKVGKTMCAYDFYESQMRLDGASSNLNITDKLKRLQAISNAGVVNIEMESVAFASMCRYAGIPGAIVCVTLVNRLDGDQIKSTKASMEELQRRPQQLVLEFIKKRLAHNSQNASFP